MWCLTCTSFLAIAFLASGDEMAFVDVSSTDTINIRSLEFTIETSPGPANFFTTDPMAAHDWVNQQTVNKTFSFIVSGLEISDSAIAIKVRDLEVKLGPLFAALPKNEHGMLANGTARYALHRFFREQHGWSLKGLEPVGSAWVASMAVTPDVRQLTKYIVLGYLHGRAYEVSSGSTTGSGISLRSLAILVATLEQVARSETLETLYSVFRTLRLPLAGVRSAEEVDDILAAYIAVYGFGTNLEVSTQRDLLASVQHLQKHHPAWSDLMDFVRSLRGSGRAGALDFASLLELVEEIADQYAKWQGRSCSQLSTAFIHHPQYSEGRLPTSATGPSFAPGLARSVLTENLEELGRLGAVATAETQRSDLLVSNYLSSKAMCLPTAGLYQVCCPSECDALLLHLEAEVASPTAGPQRLADALRAWTGTLQNARIEEHHLASLQAVAEKQGGDIALHSQDFAQWLHGVFPSVCPAPSSQGRLSPHTAGDWMLDPGDNAEDTEALVALVGQVASRFVTLGVDETVAQAARQAAEAAEDEDVDDGVIAWREESLQTGAARGVVLEFCKFAIQISIVVSMVSMVSKIGISTCRTAWPGQWTDMKKKGAAEWSFDSLA